MRRLLMVLMIVVGASGCANLGLGEADCTQRVGNVSSSTVMNVQAVPSAEFTPCLDELRLGWDSVEWFAEDGRAGLEIVESFRTFLTATVTESCDVSGAVEVAYQHPDIRRFEEVEVEATEIRIVIVPSGDQPLASARSLVDQLADAEIDDRPVKFIVDGHMGRSVSARVDVARSRGDYVWIIDELDAEEGTVQLRSSYAAATGRGLEPNVALDLIEDVVPEVHYRGNWYFTFEGGCITYEFDAEGTLAETVAADAEDALGFYPAAELRQYAEDAGFDIG
ncbi:MAG: hypothetical protein HKN01_11445 [Acidimicrobiia bacterium]|nr:hypothetical protein [Acidimicrobiia bacterium]